MCIYLCVCVYMRVYAYILTRPIGLLNWIDLAWFSVIWHGLTSLSIIRYHYTEKGCTEGALIFPNFVHWFWRDFTLIAMWFSSQGVEQVWFRSVQHDKISARRLCWFSWVSYTYFAVMFTWLLFNYRHEVWCASCIGGLTWFQHDLFMICSWSQPTCSAT